jgi:hypothetical protein
MFKNFIIPETKHAITERIQKFGSAVVSEPLIALTILSPIKLDDEFVLVTGEVNKIGTVCCLSAEVRAFHRNPPEMPPQLSLGVRGRASQ